MAFVHPYFNIVKSQKEKKGVIKIIQQLRFGKWDFHLFMAKYIYYEDNKENGEIRS